MGHGGTERLESAQIRQWQENRHKPTILHRHTHCRGRLAGMISAERNGGDISPTGIHGKDEMVRSSSPVLARRPLTSPPIGNPHSASPETIGICAVRPSDDGERRPANRASGLEIGSPNDLSGEKASLGKWSPIPPEFPAVARSVYAGGIDYPPRSLWRMCQ